MTFDRNNVYVVGFFSARSKSCNFLLCILFVFCQHAACLFLQQIILQYVSLTVAVGWRFAVAAKGDTEQVRCMLTGFLYDVPSDLLQPQRDSPPKITFFNSPPFNAKPEKHSLPIQFNAGVMQWFGTTDYIPIPNKTV